MSFDISDVPLPTRIYTPNIVHNPFTWMGIQTPDGWRVHRKRFGNAARFRIVLTGDGETTFFPDVLKHPDTGKVSWRDDLHLRDDPFTDRGIYPADPRVEYPAGNPRWAVSHTLLCYPVCDHTLYTHEYTWDIVGGGHLQTHFRRHVKLEEAKTDNIDGKTIRVKNTPISRVIEGNKHYPLPNSAVRGVWDNPEKAGKNYYATRIVQLLKMHNGVYVFAPYTPVIQCQGLWSVFPDDPIKNAFDEQTGYCHNQQLLIERFNIPLDCPRLGMWNLIFEKKPSRIYETDIAVPDEQMVTLDETHLAKLRECRNSIFIQGQVGYGINGSPASKYDSRYDYNQNGIIAEDDENTLISNLGRKIRCNLYLHAYFGNDWLTTYVNIGNTEHQPGTPVIADYTYGGGYDAEAGKVSLQNTPGPNKTVWVEYFHDAPAEAGQEIIVHGYNEEMS